MHKKLVNVWMTTQDNASTDAHAFVFLYSNIRAERWLPSKLPVSKLTGDRERKILSPTWGDQFIQMD